jgi:SAM-dependent methyltransferase
LRDQFRLPAGFIGRRVGWWMNFDNAKMNETAVKLLDVSQQDSVLELGFGPGQAIDLLVEKTAARSIAGVDPSEVMFEQARSRNAKAIDAGRVRFHCPITADTFAHFPRFLSEIRLRFSRPTFFARPHRILRSPVR